MTKYTQLADTDVDLVLAADHFVNEQQAATSSVPSTAQEAATVDEPRVGQADGVVVKHKASTSSSLLHAQDGVFSNLSAKPEVRQQAIATSTVQ